MIPGRRNNSAFSKLRNNAVFAHLKSVNSRKRREVRWSGFINPICEVERWPELVLGVAPLTRDSP